MYSECKNWVITKEKVNKLDCVTSTVLVYLKTRKPKGKLAKMHKTNINFMKN